MTTSNGNRYDDSVLADSSLYVESDVEESFISSHDDSTIGTAEGKGKNAQDNPSLLGKDIEPVDAVDDAMLGITSPYPKIAGVAVRNGDEEAADVIEPTADSERDFEKKCRSASRKPVLPAEYASDDVAAQDPDSNTSLICDDEDKDLAIAVPALRDTAEGRDDKDSGCGGTEGGGLCACLAKRNGRGYLILAGLALLIMIIFIPVGVLVPRQEASSSGGGDTTNSSDPMSPMATASPTTSAPTSSPTTATPTVSPTVTSKPTATFRPTPAPTTQTPTQVPTTSPTEQPSFQPSTTFSPTRGSQVASIVLASSVAARMGVPEYSAILNTPSTPQNKALEWLRQWEKNVFLDIGGSDVELTRRVLQRYSLTVADFALHPRATTEPFMAHPLMDECDWPGVTCNKTLAELSNTSASTTITKVVWANQGLSGEIPDELSLLHSSLEVLDLGENSLYGQIPDSLYDLTSLKSLYLHQNSLSGSISDRVSNLGELVNLLLGNNMLNGTIPQGLGSPGRGNNARPLRYLSLHRNQLTGVLPFDTNWREMWYLDLSFNQLRGRIPEDWAIQGLAMIRLRHLYLDHNRFTGPLPSILPTIGNNRLEQFLVSDNQFRGVVPSGWNNRFMQQMELQNNQFTSLGSDTCELIVYDGGELVNFRADCEICDCDMWCGSNFCY